MRILVFTRTYGKLSETFIRNELQDLGQHAEVLVVATELNGAIPKHLSYTVKIIPFEMQLGRLHRRINAKLRTRGIRFIFRDGPFAEQLRQTLDDFSPDLIHIHFGINAPYIFHNLEPALLKSIPSIVIFRGYDASSRLKQGQYCNFLNGVFANYPVTPLFVAKALRKNLRDHGINCPDGHILYSGTDTSFFCRSKTVSPPNDHRVFVQVSRFVPKKGHLYTLEAFCQFHRRHPDKKFRLIFVGDGPLLDIVQEKANNSPIRDCIEFIGHADPAHIKQLLNRAHAFVHHSVVPKSGDMEGIPNTIMEAMAMELPILASDHSGITELLSHRKHGLIVPEKDVEQYTKGIEDIYEWGPQPQNRYRVQRYFEKKQHGETLRNIYRLVLEIYSKNGNKSL